MLQLCLENFYLAKEEGWAHQRIGSVAVCVYEKEDESHRYLRERV